MVEIDDSHLDGDEMDEEDNDAAEFRALGDTKRTQIAPRWPTRVFAAQCVRRIISTCLTSPHSDAHFDLARAKDCQHTKSRGGTSTTHIKISIFR